MKPLTGRNLTVIRSIHCDTLTEAGVSLHKISAAIPKDHITNCLQRP